MYECEYHADDDDDDVDSDAVDVDVEKLLSCRDRPLEFAKPNEDVTDNQTVYATRRDNTNKRVNLYVQIVDTKEYSRNKHSTTNGQMKMNNNFTKRLNDQLSNMISRTIIIISFFY